MPPRSASESPSALNDAGKAPGDLRLFGRSLSKPLPFSTVLEEFDGGVTLPCSEVRLDSDRSDCNRGGIGSRLINGDVPLLNCGL